MIERGGTRQRTRVGTQRSVAGAQPGIAGMGPDGAGVPSGIAGIRPDAAGAPSGGAGARWGEVGEWVAASRRIVAMTGAGISTDSGIPDYRGPNGVWTLDPEAAKMVSLDAYVSEPEVRRRAWRSRRDHPAFAARPNAAHRALVDLGRTGRLHAIVTQNIDGLHQRAGSDPERVIEIHGTIHETECLGCQERGAMAETLARVAAGDPDPACLNCGGILKSATISFGQALDRATLRRATAAAMVADLFVVVGSSLTVHPAARLVEVAAHAGARVVIVNASPTPYDRLADALIHDPIGTVLPALVAHAVPGTGKAAPSVG